MPSRFAHAINAALTYSGPLSQRIRSGLPRHSMMRFSDRITRSDDREKPTSMSKPSRLKSSITSTVDRA
jgi:hypothetical protein